MIDEFPILFVAAALAGGRTMTTGLDELRVKESDRLAVMATGLKDIGARVEESEDGLIIEGSGGDPLPGGATIAGHLDHRICMSFAVAGLVGKAPVTIDDIAPVATSFPNFEAQRGIIEQAGGKVARGERVGGIVGVAVIELRLIADGAIEQPGVEHGQAEMRGERLGDRALARRGGPIDGDDHCCKPVSRASKLGKLVATGAMSSIVTGALLTRPATAKLMQMR